MAMETIQEMQLQVNLLSQYSLTSHLLPLIKKAPKYLNPTITSVSSVAALLPGAYDINDLSFKLGRPFNTMVAYGQSKRTNLLFARHLQLKLEKYGIKSTAAHPGYSRTNLFTSEGSVSFLPDVVKKAIGQSTLVSMSPEDGALMQLRALLDHENVSNGGYVVPLFMVSGRPIVSRSETSIMDSLISYVPGFQVTGMWTDKDVEELMDYSAAIMGRVIE